MAGERSRSFRFGTMSNLLIVALILAQTSLVPSARSSTVPVVDQPFKADLADVTADHYQPVRMEMLVGKMEIKEEGNLYVVKNVEDPSFLEVIEKLPSGGFGRILRYRGWSEDGKWIDLEFVYQDKENSLTILNYVSGKFFRTTFTEKRENPFSVFPLNDEKGFQGDLAAYQPSPSKFVLTAREFRNWALPEVHWLYSQLEGLSQEEVWSKRHTRGPPQGGIAS